MNLKYYKYKYNLFQENFTKKIDSNLTYIYQIEYLRRNHTINILDKLTNGINNNIAKFLKITASDLVKFNSKRKANFTRLDEKKK